MRANKLDTCAAAILRGYSRDRFFNGERAYISSPDRMNWSDHGSGPPASPGLLLRREAYFFAPGELGLHALDHDLQVAGLMYEIDVVGPQGEDRAKVEPAEPVLVLLVQQPQIGFRHPGLDRPAPLADALEQHRHWSLEIEQEVRRRQAGDDELINRPVSLVVAVSDISKLEARPREDFGVLIDRPIDDRRFGGARP